MTTTKESRTRWPKVKSVIEVPPEGLNNFEAQVKRFRAGEQDLDKFVAFHLLQGVYGQRQLDVHMFRVKIPFGGLSADQLDALGKLADRYAPLRKGHVTTQETVQLHHPNLDDTPAVVGKIIGYYQAHRQEGETFNQFVDRFGAATFEPIIEEFREVEPLNRDNIEEYMDWDKTVIYKLERGRGGVRNVKPPVSAADELSHYPGPGLTARTTF